MFLQLLRLNDNGRSTIGTMHVNGLFNGFTLEDTHNDIKIPGETRIPAGEYQVKLRATGGMHSKYTNKYGNKHHGMLWLQDVPGFEWVYIHTGNTNKDTDGCILIGNSCVFGNTQSVGRSVLNYIELYTQVIEAIGRGEDITLQII